MWIIFFRLANKYTIGQKSILQVWSYYIEVPPQKLANFGHFFWTTLTGFRTEFLNPTIDFSGPVFFARAERRPPLWFLLKSPYQPKNSVLSFFHFFSLNQSLPSNGARRARRARASHLHFINFWRFFGKFWQFLAIFFKPLLPVLERFFSTHQFIFSRFFLPPVVHKCPSLW